MTKYERHEKQLALALIDPIPNVDGTYFARIPERANINMIREMVRNYIFVNKPCIGLRYDFPSGWTRHGDFTYESRWKTYRRDQTKHCVYTVKVRTDIDDAAPDNIHYDINICGKSTTTTPTRDGTVIVTTDDSYYVPSCNIYANVNTITNRCVGYNIRETSDCYQDFDKFTYEDIIPLICPTSFAWYYPYDNPLVIRRVEINGILCKCKWSRAADGEIQYLNIMSCATKQTYFYACARLSPYVAGGYTWCNSEHAGTINIYANCTEFTCRPVEDPTPAAGPATYRAIREFITCGCLLICKD